MILHCLAAHFNSQRLGMLRADAMQTVMIRVVWGGGPAVECKAWPWRGAAEKGTVTARKVGSRAQSDERERVSSPDAMKRVGIVVIGRNEGQRLARSLASVREYRPAVVYVDSGSTDDSVALARSLGLEVLELDAQTAFTAARARNAGWRYLQGKESAPAFVQFLDGDSELESGWIAAALQFFEEHGDYAVVTGLLREQNEDASFYNRLCAMEWAVPPGDADSCGGIAMMRIGAVSALGGFRADMTAGEEPELCWRLKKDGWRIMRLEQPMALHDAGMTRFAQWWKRSVRSGHAAAQLWSPWTWRGTPHGRSTVLRAVLWGIALPIVALGFALCFGSEGDWAVATVLTLSWPLLWGVQAARLTVRSARNGVAWRLAAIHGAFNVLSKLSEGLGVLQHWINRAIGWRTRLVEYKHSNRGPTEAERFDAAARARDPK